MSFLINICWVKSSSKRIIRDFGPEKPLTQSSSIGHVFVHTYQLLMASTFTPLAKAPLISCISFYFWLDSLALVLILLSQNSNNLLYHFFFFFPLIQIRQSFRNQTSLSLSFFFLQIHNSPFKLFYKLYISVLFQNFLVFPTRTNLKLMK